MWYAFLLTLFLDSLTFLKIVRDCPDASREYSFPETRSWAENQDAVLYRDALSRGNTVKLQLIEEGLQAGGADIQRREDLPVCFVCFEIVFAADPDEPGLMTHATLLPSRGNLINDRRARVVFNRAYPCTNTSRSILAFLESNHTFHPVRRGNETWSGYTCCSRSEGIHALGLRILPVRGTRPL